MKKNDLETLIEGGYSQYQISEHFKCSQSTVRYWLKKFDLKTTHKSFKEKKIEDYGEIKLCKKCNLTKKTNEFYSKRGKKGGSSYCIECSKKISNDRHTEFKNVLISYKGGCCELCGYNKYIGALDLHHKDPKEKDFNFGKNKQYVLNQKIIDELDKCLLVCSNCHREIHGGVVQIKL